MANKTIDQLQRFPSSYELEDEDLLIMYDKNKPAQDLSNTKSITIGDFKSKLNISGHDSRIQDGDIENWNNKVDSLAFDEDTGESSNLNINTFNIFGGSHNTNSGKSSNFSLRSNKFQISLDDDGTELNKFVLDSNETRFLQPIHMSTTSSSSDAIVTKQYVDDRIEGVSGIQYQSVQVLPETGQSNIIYLVPMSGTTTTNNAKDEFIWIPGQGAASPTWQKIGSTNNIDLNGYATTADLNGYFPLSSSGTTAKVESGNLFAMNTGSFVLDSDKIKLISHFYDGNTSEDYESQISLSPNGVIISGATTANDLLSLNTTGTGTAAVTYAQMSDYVSSHGGGGGSGLNNLLDGQASSAIHQISCNAEGPYSVALGYMTIAGNSTCMTSFAEGYETFSNSAATHAEGYQTTAEGEYSHAEGYRTYAHGSNSHAEGHSTTAGGNRSHAEGYQTTASGDTSHAQGTETLASNGSAHAQGYRTTAFGIYSHAEGYGTCAYGQRSHAEGFNAKASGSGSHAEGYQTTALGRYSHTGGIGTWTNSASTAQTAIGRYNTAPTTDQAFIIGNGTSATASNALSVSWNGDVTAAGAIYLGSTAVGNAAVSCDQMTDYVGYIPFENTNSLDGTMTVLPDLQASPRISGDFIATPANNAYVVPLIVRNDQAAPVFTMENHKDGFYLITGNINLANARDLFQSASGGAVVVQHFLTTNSTILHNPTDYQIFENSPVKYERKTMYQTLWGNLSSPFNFVIDTGSLASSDSLYLFGYVVASYPTQVKSSGAQPLTVTTTVNVIKLG